ncbi:DUF6339 family protein [Bacillus benzoevorans]|uniref:Uncharacterized protein n=1 Tax=Bacillus benzoevorans TaxID=1456 RepID=A0A7X0LYU3_9BACI|nr:DUF6339 family protein [Bacillus benzoevorans]MBB6447794.1 hypothetical protein [Bacillus benzoevorans]
MWKTLSKSEARKEFNNWEPDKIPESKCDGKELQLRNELLDADLLAVKFLEENEPSNKKGEYLYDLRYGIEIYEQLKNNYHFTTRHASNDEIWIYLSMKVVPDLVFKRWGLSDTRFFSQSRRIWLKTMWWYIHLSWAGNSEDTYKILKGFTTDEVVQLVERSGPSGYRIDVTREIMKQFSNLELYSENRSLFRKIMKLNTARLKIIEPALTEGGVKKYVEEIIGYFNEINTSSGKNQTAV